MKKQLNQKIKLNNEGFTLVELLLSIMILAIVSTAIFSFMIVGSRMFTKTNLEVDMQYEAQIMKNYMNDLITDTTKQLQFYQKSDNHGNTFGADNCLVIYTEDCVAYLAWIKESNQVHYLEKNKDSFVIDEQGKYLVDFNDNEKQASNWPVMAKYVSGFQCNLEDLKKEHRIFSSVLSFKLQEKEYSTTHTITLRNEVFYEGSTEEFRGGVLGDYEAQVTRITLAPGMVDKTIDRVNGTTVEFTHTVTAVGDIDKSVIYTVEGNFSQNTQMRDNVLYIAPDETSRVLTVICKSKMDEGVSTTAIVNIANVSVVNIIASQEPNYKEKYYYPNTEIDFRAVVEGEFFTKDGSYVTWEIIRGPVSAKIIESTSTTCKVNTGNEMNETIVLKATSVVDSDISAEYVIHTADIEIGEIYIAAVGGQYNLKRGDSLQLQVLVNGQNTQDGMIVNWNLEESSLTQDKLSIDANGKITASTKIPYDKEYEVKVGVSVTDTVSGKVKTSGCMLNIEKVDITFEPASAIVVAKDGSKNTNRIKIYVNGLKIEDNAISIQQRPYVRGLRHWIVTESDGNEYSVLGLYMQSDKFIQDNTVLRVSLKGQNSVYKDLPVAFFNYNLIHQGNYIYAPVPGDATNLIGTVDENGTPYTEKEVKINNVVYGYTNVMVNNVTYHYYVDKTDVDTNIDWYMRIENDSNKYRYDYTKKQYISMTP